MVPASGIEESRGGIERREHERISTRIEVRFKGPEQAARAFRAYSLNFSAGGLCFRTDRTYQLGAPLRVSLTVAEQAFDFDAVVAWAHKGAIGVRFENVSETDQQRLGGVMQALKR